MKLFPWMPYPPMPGPMFAFLPSIVYLVVLVVGQRLMRDRPAMPMKPVQALHNLILCVFSGVGFTSMTIDLVWMALEKRRGIDYFLCDPDHALYNGLSGWVMLAFLVSKIYEFVDTLLLVVGKSRIRFLHWFHHAATLVLTWYLYVNEFATGGFFAYLNLGVHTPMYYYYMVTALGKTVWWKQYLTSIQIIQFIICIALLLYTLGMQFLWTGCPAGRPVKPALAVWSILAYAVFLILFVQLYVENYKRPKVPGRSVSPITTPRAGTSPASTPGLGSPVPKSPSPAMGDPRPGASRQKAD